jgi:hypothetical protein
MLEKSRSARPGDPGMSGKANWMVGRQRDLEIRTQAKGPKRRRDGVEIKVRRSGAVAASVSKLWRVLMRPLSLPLVGGHSMHRRKYREPPVALALSLDLAAINTGACWYKYITYLVGSGRRGGGRAAACAVLAAVLWWLAASSAVMLSAMEITWGYTSLSPCRTHTHNTFVRSV